MFFFTVIGAIQMRYDDDDDDLNNLSAMTGIAPWNVKLSRKLLSHDEV